MYLHTLTQRYPVSESEIRSLFPNTSFPVPFVAPEDYVWVFPAPQPAFNSISQSVREIAPELTSKGTWQQRWEVIDLDADTIAANQQAAALRLKDEVITNTQKRLDDFARTRLYDGILSLCTYATSTNPKFSAEGQYGVNARDATWATLYQILDEVQAGTRPIPSGYAEIEPLLPALEWPA